MSAHRGKPISMVSFPFRWLLRGFGPPFPQNSHATALFRAEIAGHFAFPPWKTGFICPTMTSPEIDIPPETLHRGVLQFAPCARLKHKKWMQSGAAITR